MFRLRWRKLGCIFNPADSGVAWMRTHAALPIPVPVDERHIRVYCAGRDAEGRAQIGVVDIEVGDAPRCLAIASEPALRFGPLGAFDDRGVLPACIVRRPGDWLLYYTGVMLGQTVPFYYAVGAAASHDEGRSWERLSPAPVLERSAIDPFLTASPFVLHDGEAYRMWYTSGVRWIVEDGRPKHEYLLKEADSQDGLNWERSGRITVNFAPGDYAISRPSVLRDGAGYHMWFAHRGDAYRIGYAHSSDGAQWTRRDDLSGILPSASGWDAEMICYPAVFDHFGRRYMLYNGNGYGRSGFGLAVLDE